MKKQFLFLLILPLLFGCPYRWEHINKHQLISLTLNENSPSDVLINDTINYTPDSITYTVSHNVEIDDIGAISVNSLKLRVTNFQCSQLEVKCKLSSYHYAPVSYHYHPNWFGFETYSFLAKEDFEGEIPPYDFLSWLEIELEDKGFASIDFQTKLPASNVNFEIELELNIDMTISY